ncbi:MAG TPA: MmgE/PrpD family protein [Candidatus Binatia bacterium]
MKDRQRTNTAQKIAGWVARIHSKAIPATVLEKAKEHLLDGFATMIAGSREDASERSDEYLRQLRSTGNATVIGSGMKVAGEHAALANGIRGHVLDYDDAQLATLPNRPFGQLTHPTAPVLAASLAMAESIHANGAALVTAYVVGVEIACRVADAVDPRHYLNGFHPTGTIAAFGAAAACAHLLKLRENEVNWALGICGSLASGIRAQRGTMAKSLNAGRAAQNGVVSASLAKIGFTATRNVFDDPMGFVNASCYRRFEKRAFRLGHPFFLIEPGIAIKRYPCPSVIHPALDAIIDLAQKHDIEPVAVKRIRVLLGPDAALPLVYKEPRTALEAKFSLSFSAAVAVLHRKAGPSEYSGSALKNPEIVRLMKTVELIRSAKLKTRGNSGALAEIKIDLHDGRSYSARNKTVNGHPKRPLSRAEIEQKFVSCAAGSISNREANSFVKQLWSLEKVSRLTPWLDLLRSCR